ncbi:MAG: YafY family transcriptional regulator [Lachnospiraceae bacterium]|nr:YafY family transcriptional regulator [Butyrivibrio sp.]MCM1344292.1 YafY family transcriptional regulator [Muribaculaceae bacterium]MCM1410527.1 YafY family transcriptional regulator [Lachnospiraceae bacterium]
MKTDRILEIVIYLINHDNVPASYLAERFHVSVRTIQRDIVSISAIGIPVYAEGGRYGGYSILPGYKLKNGNLKGEEQQMILKALESLATSYTSDTLDALIEKYNAIIEKEGGQKMFWDFGVTRENRHVQDRNRLLEQAITERRYVTFDYRNAEGESSTPSAEPLTIHYKWYAWYLFAYVPEKKQYRTFKVARMQNLRMESTVSAMEHGDVERRMKDSEKAYYQTCIRIELQFDKGDAGLMAEYFPDCPAEPVTETTSRIFLDVPAGERLWKALLLSFGDKVTVVGPEEYRRELISTAEKFLSNYDT